MTIADSRLEQLAARFAELEARLSSGTLDGILIQMRMLNTL